MAAASQVFDTAELLENILLRLPASDILSAQRINSFSRSTVEGSIHLRRALYLEQSPMTSNDISDVKINPLIKGQQFGHYNLKIYVSKLAEDGVSWAATAPMLFINMLRRDEKRGTEASWKRMYLTNKARGIHLKVRPVKNDIKMASATLEEIVQRADDAFEGDELQYGYIRTEHGMRFAPGAALKQKKLARAQ